MDLKTGNPEDLSIKTFVDALKCIGVENISRAGFKTQAFFPLDMTFAEMSELMFGSLVVESSELGAICGKAHDALVQLHGVYKGLQSQTVIAPQNAEQVIQTFVTNPNLDQLIEPKLFDTGLKDFRDRIAMDCLLVDTDLSLENTTPEALQDFARQSLDSADEIAAATVARFKRIPVRGPE